MDDEVESSFFVNTECMVLPHMSYCNEDGIKNNIIIEVNLRRVYKHKNSLNAISLMKNPQRHIKYICQYMYKWGVNLSMHVKNGEAA